MGDREGTSGRGTCFSDRYLHHTSEIVLHCICFKSLLRVVVFVHVLHILRSRKATRYWWSFLRLVLVDSKEMDMFPNVLSTTHFSELTQRYAPPRYQAAGSNRNRAVQVDTVSAF